MNNLKRWFVIAVVALSIAAPAIALTVDVQQQTEDSALIARGPTKGDDNGGKLDLKNGMTSRGYTWGG